MFTEQNSIENLIRDLLCGQQKQVQGGIAQAQATYLTFGRAHKGTGWHFIPAIDLHRRINVVFVEAHVRQALVRLNPGIAEKPERVDKVLYKLRAMVLSVQSPSSPSLPSILTVGTR